MAKRFTFRLETVLRLRRIEEDKHKRIVAGRVHQIQNSRGRIVQMHDAIRVENRQFALAAGAGALDMDYIRKQRHFVACMHEGVSHQQHEISRLNERLAAERADLARASMRAKVVEKLKEKQHARYRKKVEKIEQSEMDETALRVCRR